MEAKKLNVEKRPGGGKSAAGRLRGDGKIPAVVYGHTSPTAITVDAREFRNAFKRITENTIVELHMPDGVHEVLVKDYQRDNLTGQVMHVDFYEFEKGKALRTRVPVRLIGNPVGVKEGGILEVLMHQIEVECLPKDLPEEITLDINELALDRAMHVSSLVLPAGVRSLIPSDQVVCLVAHRKAEEEVAPAAVEGEAAAEGEEGAAVAEGAEGAESAEGAEEGAKPEKGAKAEKAGKPERKGKKEE
ncbi:MAG TPA: 50S ribosomal protein L25 [Spirochaetia bacterium]|nr:50S ribosomal protein L25 [Spirochaetia bacterium]